MKPKFWPPQLTKISPKLIPDQKHSLSSSLDHWILWGPLFLLNSMPQFLVLKFKSTFFSNFSLETQIPGLKSKSRPSGHLPLLWISIFNLVYHTFYLHVQLWTRIECMISGVMGTTSHLSTCNILNNLLWFNNLDHKKTLYMSMSLIEDPNSPFLAVSVDT